MLYALSAHSGREIWSRYLSGAFAADYPVVVGQTLYQPDENGQMFALPMSEMTGQALRQLPCGRRLFEHLPAGQDPDAGRAD